MPMSKVFLSQRQTKLSQKGERGSKLQGNGLTPPPSCINRLYLPVVWRNKFFNAYPCKEEDPDADHEVGEPDGIAAVVGLVTEFRIRVKIK